jgi:hypothetical protein
MTSFQALPNLFPPEYSNRIPGYTIVVSDQCLEIISIWPYNAMVFTDFAMKHILVF